MTQVAQAARVVPGIRKATRIRRSVGRLVGRTNVRFLFRALLATGAVGQFDRYGDSVADRSVAEGIVIGHSVGRSRFSLREMIQRLRLKLNGFALCDR
jgi:hypothetical protein